MNIDEDAINKIIYNLPPKSSSGCDGISTKLLKVIAPVIIKPLTLLINQVLITGTFPDKLKIAKVIPIFKKGDPSLFENYRPISLLPAISKVLEKIIALQLSSYFEKNKLLFDNQYGFRPKHSTEHAALELIDRITNKMDTNRGVKTSRRPAHLTAYSHVCAGYFAAKKKKKKKKLYFFYFLSYISFVYLIIK